MNNNNTPEFVYVPVSISTPPEINEDKMAVTVPCLFGKVIEDATIWKDGLITYDITRFKSKPTHWLKPVPLSSLAPATGRWVKAETLPEIIDNRYSKRVLCLTSSGLMRVGYILNGEWVEDNRGTRFFNNGYIVTHWQPLPLPPPPDETPSQPKGEQGEK